MFLCCHSGPQLLWKENQRRTRIHRLAVFVFLFLSHYDFDALTFNIGARAILLEGKHTDRQFNSDCFLLSVPLTHHWFFYPPALTVPQTMWATNAPLVLLMLNEVWILPPQTLNGPHQRCWKWLIFVAMGKLSVRWKAATVVWGPGHNIGRIHDPEAILAQNEVYPTLASIVRP